jgi:hypothetical protein
MNIKDIFKPTKLKIYGLFILIIGFLIPKIINFFIHSYYARNLGPEKYQIFLNSLQSNSAWNIVLLVLGIIWYYILVSIIIYLSKKK